MGEKRQIFQRKMERAEEKRRQHLQDIVNKAHDEEKKAKEIAFINGLEAKNKLHDIMQQHQVFILNFETIYFIFKKNSLHLHHKF